MQKAWRKKTAARSFWKNNSAGFSWAIDQNGAAYAAPEICLAAAAAVVVAATAATAVVGQGSAEAVAAPAAQEQDEKDDPPAVIVAIHNEYLREIFSAAFAVPSAQIAINP